MTIHEQTMSKIQQLAEPLAQEVSDFIDFLLVKQDQTRWELWTHFSETLAMARKRILATTYRTWKRMKSDLAVETGSSIGQKDGKHMKGIQFVVDDQGEKTAVLINLQEHGDLWEDFYDCLHRPCPCR